MVDRWKSASSLEKPGLALKLLQDRLREAERWVRTCEDKHVSALEAERAAHKELNEAVRERDDLRKEEKQQKYGRL